MNSVEIIDHGMLTTIQDLGRFGYQRYGVTPSGVMDEYSAKMANILVGNGEGYPVFETTFKGVGCKFNGECVIAVTGGENNVLLNGREVPMWESVRVRSGDIIQMEFCRSGVRNYIAFQGGFDISKILGSYSTNLKSKLGGFNGRAIKKGDIIPLRNASKTFIPKMLSRDEIPKFESFQTIRVVLGPQDDAFTEAGHKTFFGKEYEVSRDGDRMGIRFTGDPVEHIAGADIISDGISFGAIQIPGNGQPIIMMADRQTTGGYTKIGNVITSDLYKIAQLPPGSKVKFQLCKEEEAVEILREYRGKFSEAAIEKNIKNLQGYKNYKITVNSKSFNVYIKEA